MILSRFISNRNKVCIFGVLGFFMTGVLFYPYATFWDSARTLTYILVNGHANIDNWLGWYFPLLWDFLYKLTGIPNIMGTWILFLYWIGVTLLYFNLFNVERRSLWWYIAFSWFPGTLMFVLNITNNALMLVMLILGLAFWCIYSKKKQLRWLILAIITIVQCCFIRRESFVMMVPIVFVFLYIHFLYKNNKLRAVLYSFILGVVIFISIFGIEKKITRNIANYDYMDALSITCIHDMSAVSYETGKLCIPTHLLKKEYSDGTSVMSLLNSMEPDSIWNGDVLIHRLMPFLKVKDAYMLHLDRNDVLSFYRNNFFSWLKFKIRYASRFFWFRQPMCYSTKQDNKMILYSPPNPKVLQKVISYAVPGILGSVQFFYYLSFIVLFFDWKKIIKYRSERERCLILCLIVVTFFETILVMFTSIAVQYRYLYPVCVLQYLIFIYVLSRLNYKSIVSYLSSNKE